jgi:hypothetical protein
VVLLTHVVQRVGGGWLVMLGGTAIFVACAFNAWGTFGMVVIGSSDQLLHEIYWIMDAIGMALLMTSYGLYRRRLASKRHDHGAVPGSGAGLRVAAQD